MNKKTRNIAVSLAFAIMQFFVTGCKTIVRENIISSIDTGVGATVAENKQTQFYELKAGYIRSQFYSVPTGKLVENSAASGDTAIVTSPDGATVEKGQISNAANVTPDIVSGIRSHSGLGDLLLGMDISESFAVGKNAVNSPAAIAMYIAQATNAAVAQAAASATATNQTSQALMVAVNDSSNKALRAQLDGLLAKPLAAAKAKNPDGTAFTGTTTQYANYLASTISPGSTVTEVRIWGGANLQQLIKQLTDAETP